MGLPVSLVTTFSSSTPGEEDVIVTGGGGPLWEPAPLAFALRETPNTVAQNVQAASLAEAQYVGRVVDLMAFTGVKASGRVLLEQRMAAPGEAGMICTGIQKLAQRVMVELLTRTGTLPYAPTRGTRLMTLLLQGTVNTQLDAIQAMNGALVELKTNLQGEETAADPDDERYDSTEVLSVTFAPGNVQYSLYVHSRAGTGRKIILPAPITVGRIVSLP